MKFYSKFIFRSPINSAVTKFEGPVFEEALYLSTPALYDEYKKHLVSPLTDTRDLKKLNGSIYKYQSRASYRCTPFGLFAGVGTGEPGEENKIVIDADLSKSLNRKTRLDMNVVCSLAQHITRQAYVKEYLKFYPNNSLYLVGDTYRYIEYFYKNNKRYHKINKVDHSNYLSDILLKSAEGLTHKQLIATLINEEITAEEATAFVDELVENQLLVNQFDPVVTGEDYFQVMLKYLKDITLLHPTAELAQVCRVLETITALIKKCDSDILNAVGSYREIHLNLKNVLPELSETNLFQTDLYKKTISATINGEILDQIEQALKFLNKINPSHSNPKLDSFRQRFQDRYEEAEVPLLMALDTETGIGYPARDNNGINVLIDDVHKQAANNENDIKWNSLQACLLKLITGSIKKGKKIIEISEDDFKQIDFSTESIPTTISVMFKVLDASSNKIELQSAGNSSAVNLLGRFAGGNEELDVIVRELAAFEQANLPGKILAEIIHLPESRTGNILARPSFREYEIPYLAKSSVANERQVKMDDLVLKIVADKIVLFDKRLQKEIIPRLGNAHNYSHNSLPVYHFLCDLQCQYFAKPYFGFNWGPLSNQFSFLPRVEYKNTVLSAAKWQLAESDLQGFKEKGKSDTDKRSLFFEMKSKLELPDKFYVVDGDNDLLIDINNIVAIDTFIEIAKNRGGLNIEEFLYDTENSLVIDTAGNVYTNECIAILLNESNKKEENVITFKKPEDPGIYSVGSEWLYYKIYCGAKTADYVLTEKLVWITEILLEEKIIDRWFFIRYADPEIHIRFRLHVSDLQQLGKILLLVNEHLEPLIHQNVIFKIQTDTYKQELGRYGENTMVLAEQLFYGDSVFVAKMLSLLDGDNGGEIRWQMAVRSVDEFLNDFAFTTEEKYEFVNQLSLSFFQEHGGKKELRLLLDEKFRKLRPQVELVLNPARDEQMDYYPLIELLQQRSFFNASVVSEINQVIKNGQLQVSSVSLISSFLHMNLDRLFMGRNRTNEFVVYDLLSRYYKSVIARQKARSRNQPPITV